MTSTLAPSFAADHVHAVIADRLRDAESARLARGFRRTPARPVRSAAPRRPSFLSRWGRRVRLQAAR